jgi:hypothetical protein
LAEALGDTPQMTTTAHALQTGRCRAWAVGPASQFRAALVQTDYIPDEPYGYGDPGLIADLLRLVPSWGSVNIAKEIAPTVAQRLEALTGKPMQLVDDLYFTLTAAPAAISHPAVRQLLPADRALLAGSHRQVQGADVQYAHRLLNEGLAVAAVIDGRIACTVHSYCMTPRHAEIGANTLPAFRGQGLASAAAGMLCRLIQNRGLLPVWSTGRPNTISQRLAAKLNFTPILPSRIYVLRST